MRSFPVALLFFTQLAFAKMTVVRDACEDKDWSQVRCEFLDQNPFNINYRAEDESISRASDIGGHLSTLFEELNSINSRELDCFSDSGRLGRLTNYTKRMINRKPLSNCQKACVVKCVTANFITYSRPDKAKVVMDSACAAANSGTGTCRAYSNLADHLMDEVGLRSHSRASAPHAYNRIWLNNRWYYGEPQDSECRFFMK